MTLYKTMLFTPKGLISTTGITPEEALKSAEVKVGQLTYRPADGTVYAGSLFPCGMLLTKRDRGAWIAYSV